jgi:alpha-beta hydrolase superfamily lysophospholipase
LPRPTFAGNAGALIAAVDDLCSRVKDGCTGVVLVGHSMGGAIATHIASRPRSAETYDGSTVAAAAAASSPIPVAELLEVVDGWIRDFPGIAAAVDVPVHYGLSEHEQLWISKIFTP